MTGAAGTTGGTCGATRRLAAALALAALLVLAGCSVGTGGPSPEATPTLTPAPVPDEGGTGAGGDGGGGGGGGSDAVGGRQLAPGLRAGGVADPFALAQAHHESLENRSFTRTDSRTIVDDNGTLRATRTELQVAADETPFLLDRSAVSAPRYDVRSPYDDVAIYHDGNGAFYRLVTERNVTYGADPGAVPAEVAGDRRGNDAVVGLLTAFDWEVQPLEIGGERRYRLTSSTLVDPDALDDAYLLTDPRDAEIRLLIGPDGRVHRYRLSYRSTYDARGVGVTETARWSAVDGTSVPEPDWLDRARNGTAVVGRNGQSGSVGEVLDG